MTYLETINGLKVQLEAMKSPARLDIPFQESRPPTQAFSEFLTNKEQGDWAEQTFVENFNSTQPELWAVKYGRSEDLVAGESGFDKYYRAYQAELAEIGKRPDLLVFERSVFAAQYQCVTDISTLNKSELDALVPKARMAIEVRSSAFLSRKYDQATALARTSVNEKLLHCAHRLNSEFEAELSRSVEWKAYVQTVIGPAFDVSQSAPRAMSLRSTGQLAAASKLTSEIKACLKELAKRDSLSITPKAEDLSLVYRWIQTYQVPHHYCQVFFDRAVMIAFEKILSVLATPDREGKDYFIESDEKNQGKVTFKINVQLGKQVMDRIVLPAHSSAMKELPKGRLLFYVKFEPSKAEVQQTGWDYADH